MTKYLIENTISGASLGTYEGDTEQEALDAMARDAGYRDHADACDVCHSDGSDLVVTEVEPPTTPRKSTPPCSRCGSWCYGDCTASAGY